MTDLAGALAAKMLTSFEGRDVVQSKVEIPSAAGGLRDAMKFDPIELAQGQRVFVLMECTTGKIRFDPVKVKGEDLGTLARVHVLDAELATFVDAAFAREHLDRQREVIRQAQEEAAGIQGLPFGEDLDGDEPDDFGAGLRALEDDDPEDE